MIIREVPPDHADAHRLVQAYFGELRARLGTYEAPSFAELRADGERGAVFVAMIGAATVGCAWLRLLESDTAEVKRMYVVPEGRGQGVAKQLLTELETKARTLGCTRVVLDTAAPLVEAGALYLRAGYVEIERYNDNPYAARWFSKAL